MKTKPTIKKIAIFASGNGSNAENIIRYFREADRGAQVALVVTNKPEAGVISRAEKLDVDVSILPPASFKDPDTVMPLLDSHGIDLIILAGFLLMVPVYLIRRYPDRIVNIHPALLPKFGGKGMYGHHVHEAVVAAGESESGITVHLVSEFYDEGRIIFQARTSVEPYDTAADVEAKIHGLEREHFPRVIHEHFIINQ